MATGDVMGIVVEMVWVRIADSDSCRVAKLLPKSISIASERLVANQPPMFKAILPRFNGFSFSGFVFSLFILFM